MSSELDATKYYKMSHKERDEEGGRKKKQRE